MYFNFALNLNMSLSSVDNLFKQFGPRSGAAFSRDLKGFQTVWHFRGYDKFELNPIFYCCVKTLHDFVSRWYQLISISNISDSDQAQHSVWTWSWSKLFDTLEVTTSWSWTNVFKLWVKPLHDIVICWKPFQVIWIQIRPNILPAPVRGPNYLTL